MGYNTDGKIIAATLKDGSIRVWDVRDKIGNDAVVCMVPPPPKQMIDCQKWSFLSGSEHLIKRSHSHSDFATGIVFSNDGNTFATRTSHDSLCVWDLRNVSQLIKTISGLPNVYTNTNVILSPSEEFFVTGTSAVGSGPLKNKFGSVCFINKKRLESVLAIGVGGPAIQLAWHSKSNQILVTGGNKKGGYVKVFYNP